MLSSLSLGEHLNLPRFALGGLILKGVNVTAIPVEESGGWRPATLGMDVLSRFRVTLDVPRMRLLLEPTPGFPVFRAGYSGVDLSRSGGTFRIQSVQAASPGAAAGLRAGDAVLSIDGRRLAGLRLYTVNNIAGGEANTPAAFVTDRAGVTRTIRFRRLDLFKAPPQVLLGLIGRRDATGPLVVKAVVPGCPADIAGIAPGDEIAAFDGQPAATVTGETLAQLSHQAHLMLTFKRPGEAAPRPVRLDRPGAGPDLTAPKTAPPGE